MRLSLRCDHLKSSTKNTPPPLGVTGHLVLDLNTREGCFLPLLCASPPVVLGKHLDCQLVQSASESFSCSQSSPDWHVSGSWTVAVMYYQNYAHLHYFLWTLKAHDEMTLNIRSSQDWQLWKQSPSYLKYRAITCTVPQAPKQQLQKNTGKQAGFSEYRRYTHSRSQLLKSITLEDVMDCYASTLEFLVLYYVCH